MDREEVKNSREEEERGGVRKKRRLEQKEDVSSMVCHLAESFSPGPSYIILSLSFLLSGSLAGALQLSLSLSPSI